jgi:hypothetical protein
MIYALGRLAISAIAAWLLWELWRAFSQGSIHSYGVVLRRDKNPLGFWLTVAFCMYGSVIILATLNLGPVRSALAGWETASLAWLQAQPASRTRGPTTG